MAGLMVDGSRMSVDELNDWAEKAYWYMISDYTVAWTAGVHPEAQRIALRWIDSGKEFVMSAGWATLSHMVAIREDASLDKDMLKQLVNRVVSELHSAPNRVRYTMNGFIIAAGSYVPDLTEFCKEAGRKLGKVEVDMGGTSCKVPKAPEYIEKVEKAGRIGRKRTQAAC